MTTAAASLPYTPVEPLPLPRREGCPTTLKVIAVASIVLTCVAAGVALGIGFSMLYWDVISYSGGIVGGTLGALLGLFLSVFTGVTDPVASYRLGTLKQLEGTGSTKSFLEGIQVARQFFSRPLSRFGQAYHPHLLYRALIGISDGIEQEREDLVGAWRRLLEHLDGTKVRNPDGTELTLSMKTVLDRLSGVRIQTSRQQLNRWSPFYTSVCQEIEELQKISFGAPYTFSVREFKEALAASWSNTCYLVRDASNSALLGFGWFRIKEENGETFYQISGIARRPDAAGLGIGRELLIALVEQIGSGRDVRLLVRKSNPAVDFYKSFGFELHETREKFYPLAPPEDAFVLKLNWDIYRRAK